MAVQGGEPCLPVLLSGPEGFTDLLGTSLLMNPSKAFFISVTMFFSFLVFCFDSSLVFLSLCLHYPSVLNMLSIFSFRELFQIFPYLLLFFLIPGVIIPTFM